MGVAAAFQGRHGVLVGSHGVVLGRCGTSGVASAQTACAAISMAVRLLRPGTRPIVQVGTTLGLRPGMAGSGQHRRSKLSAVASTPIDEPKQPTQRAGLISLPTPYRRPYSLCCLASNSECTTGLTWVEGS